MEPSSVVQLKNVLLGPICPADLGNSDHMHVHSRILLLCQMQHEVHSIFPFCVLLRVVCSFLVCSISDVRRCVDFSHKF